jgi:hypothetical protein
MYHVKVLDRSINRNDTNTNRHVVEFAYNLDIAVGLADACILHSAAADVVAAAVAAAAAAVASPEHQTQPINLKSDPSSPAHVSRL